MPAAGRSPRLGVPSAGPHRTPKHPKRRRQEWVGARDAVEHQAPLVARWCRSPDQPDTGRGGASSWQAPEPSRLTIRGRCRAYRATSAILFYATVQRLCLATTADSRNATRARAQPTSGSEQLTLIVEKRHAIASEDRVDLPLILRDQVIERTLPILIGLPDAHRHQEVHPLLLV